MSTQHVYVMALAEDGPCKIGISVNPLTRLATIRTASPDPVELWSAWIPEHLSARDVERAAHEHFAAQRLAGEWLAVSVKQAERFIGAVERAFDGFSWIMTHDGPALRVYE